MKFSFYISFRIDNTHSEEHEKGTNVKIWLSFRTSHNRSIHGGLGGRVEKRAFTIIAAATGWVTPLDGVCTRERALRIKNLVNRLCKRKYTGVVNYCVAPSRRKIKSASTNEPEEKRIKHHPKIIKGSSRICFGPFHA